jgi:hypothetical protein
MNELTKVARGIGAADLPDRWEGLSSFESIIWTNAPVQGLGIDQARALLDWTRRGGNLVIVLPESGDPWGIGGQRTRTPLGEALPERAERHDAVQVSKLLPVLSRTNELRNASARTAVWTFPADPGNGFVPLILAPAEVDARSGNLLADDGIAGQALAVRRPFGFGFVTVVGVDVDGLDRRSLAVWSRGACGRRSRRSAASRIPEDRVCRCGRGSRSCGPRGCRSAATRSLRGPPARRVPRRGWQRRRRGTRRSGRPSGKPAKVFTSSLLAGDGTGEGGRLLSQKLHLSTLALLGGA